MLDQRVGVVAEIDHLTADNAQPVAPFIEADAAAGADDDIVVTHPQTTRRTTAPAPASA